jgi:hypothetical protein
MTDETKTSTSQANRLYGIATTALREAHRDEFEGLLNKAYADAGVERKVRRTPEQVAAEKTAAAAAREAAKEQARKEKALATAQALAAEFPDLLTVTAPAPHLTEPGF